MTNTSQLATMLLTGLALGLTAFDRSYAEEVDVNKTAEALHAAISSLDAAKIEALWAHDARVTLVNPTDKTVSVGWDAVKANWEGITGRYNTLKIAQVDGPYVTVKGKVAWRTGVASSIGQLKSGAEVNARVIETDIFEKRGGKWFIVSHTAVRAPN